MGPKRKRPDGAVNSSSDEAYGIYLDPEKVLEWKNELFSMLSAPNKEGAIFIPLSCIQVSREPDGSANLKDWHKLMAYVDSVTPTSQSNVVASKGETLYEKLVSEMMQVVTNNIKVFTALDLIQFRLISKSYSIINQSSLWQEHAFALIQKFGGDLPAIKSKASKMNWMHAVKCYTGVKPAAEFICLLCGNDAKIVTELKVQEKDENETTAGEEEEERIASAICPKCNVCLAEAAFSATHRREEKEKDPRKLSFGDCCICNDVMFGKIIQCEMCEDEDDSDKKSGTACQSCFTNCDFCNCYVCDEHTHWNSGNTICKTCHENDD